MTPRCDDGGASRAARAAPPPTAASCARHRRRSRWNLAVRASSNSHWTSAIDLVADPVAPRGVLERRPPFVRERAVEHELSSTSLHAGRFFARRPGREDVDRARPVAAGAVRSACNKISVRLPSQRSPPISLP